MAHLKGDSNKKTVPAVYGENTAGGDGVFGHSNTGAGVHCESDKFHGMFGVCHNPYGAGVFATNDAGGTGVVGDSKVGNGTGIFGESQNWEGVHGIGHGPGAGVTGKNDGPPGVGSAAPGVWGESQNWEGVHGVGHARGAGVTGFNDGPADGAAAGVWGESQNWEGVHGIGHGRGAGVIGINDGDGQQQGAAAGVWGESNQFDGVFGISHNPNAAGVSGHNPGGLAGYFDGNVTVTGDIQLINADCAEHFDIANTELAQPGTVMVLGDDGVLQPSHCAYDRRVAGVVSGAGNYKPGITLDKQQSPANRKPVALLGKVYCKVDASLSPIGIGDLLTTAPTPGHAMKATDQQRAFGAVIGKALRPLESGCGLIPILVSLQ